MNGLRVAILFPLTEQQFVVGQFQGVSLSGAVSIHSNHVVAMLTASDGTYRYPNCLSPSKHRDSDIVAIVHDDEHSRICDPAGQRLSILHNQHSTPHYAADILCVVTAFVADNAIKVKIVQKSTKLHWPAGHVSIENKVLHEGVLAELPMQFGQFQAFALEAATGLVVPPVVVETPQEDPAKKKKRVVTVENKRKRPSKKIVAGKPAKPSGRASKPTSSKRTTTKPTTGKRRTTKPTTGKRRTTKPTTKKAAASRK